MKSINSEFAEDTYSGEYADENDQIETDAEFTINNPNFDPETMRETMPNSQFRGGNTPQLAEDIIKLYDNPKGKELEEALQMIAQIRGLEIGNVREQYHRAMKIKAGGEKRDKPKLKQHVKLLKETIDRARTNYNNVQNSRP